MRKLLRIEPQAEIMPGESVITYTELSPEEGTVDYLKQSEVSMEVFYYIPPLGEGIPYLKIHRMWVISCDKEMQVSGYTSTEYIVMESALVRVTCRKEFISIHRFWQRTSKK